MIFPRCAGCPALDLPECHAQVTGHKRFCTLVARKPSYRAYVRQKSQEPRRRVVVPLVDDSKDMRIGLLYGAARACPWRIEVPAGCCTTTKCGEGGMRPGDRVSIADCVACVLVRDIPEGVNPDLARILNVN